MHALNGLVYYHWWWGRLLEEIDIVNVLKDQLTLAALKYFNLERAQIQLPMQNIR